MARDNIRKALDAGNEDLLKLQVGDLTPEEWRELAAYYCTARNHFRARLSQMRQEREEAATAGGVEQLTVLIERLRNLREHVREEGEKKESTSFPSGLLSGFSLAAIAAREQRDKLLGIEELPFATLDHPAYGEV